MLDIITVPFGYIMRLIYEIVGNYGFAIIIFSLLAKLVLLPLSYKTKKGMVDIQRMQPRINALQKKYGKDPAQQQKLNEELQKIYAEEGVNPLGTCLPTLLTFPIMIGLYYVISKPLTYFMGLSTGEITSIAEILGVTTQNINVMEIEVAGQIFQNFDKIAHVSDKLMPVNFDFLGMNLAATPQFSVFNLLWIIPILSGLTAYLYSWVTQRSQPVEKDNPAASSTKMMSMMMPLMSVYFGFILPAGLGIYWISNNIFSAVQDLALASYFQKKAPPPAVIEAEVVVKPKKPNLGNTPSLKQPDEEENVEGEE